MTFRNLASRLRDTLAADRTEWRLSPAATVLIASIPVAMAAAGVLAFPFRPVYRFLANEDGVVEWSQLLLIVLLLGLYARLAIGLWRSGHRRLAPLFGVATIAMVFLAGGEISGGQRIFGWGTPEELDDINDQGETNIHNVGVLLRLFNLGLVGVCAAAIALPIARWIVWRDRPRSFESYLFIPPLALIPAFAFPLVYRLTRYLILPEPRYVITKYSEFAELSFFFGLVVFAVVASRMTLSAPSVREPAASTREGGPRPV